MTSKTEIPAVAPLQRPAPASVAPRHRLSFGDVAAGYRWLSGLSFPRRYPLIQFPNTPLILAFLAGQAASRLHGGPHDDAQAVSYLSMIVWAYEELVHGVNRFRNLLGLYYVVSTTTHLAAALHP